MTKSNRSHFDPDIKEQVNLFVVHGSWKKEDRNRVFIEDAVARHKNVKAITAYMPEAYGTHHSKMIITVRHDDLAQVCIFTANLIEQDWGMCQAVWRSPELPLLQGQNDLKPSEVPLLQSQNGLKPPELPLLQGQNDLKVTDKIGSGTRFKFDLLSYLRAYNNRLRDLVSTLDKFDFGSVRGALVASTPGRQKTLTTGGIAETRWGWPGLAEILQQIPCKGATPRVVVQISSVATLGVRDNYLRDTFFAALAHSSNQPKVKLKYSIVFPTAGEIRRSISGYACGGSIHMKIQSPQQVKQLDYLRPLLCRWAPDLREERDVKRAGRRRSGPHIKTYVRFSDEAMTKIDWAMVTSANLSKQAWGAESDKDGAVRISSYEIGVVVWPALWNESPNGQVEMVPTFKKDDPDSLQEKDLTRIGFRMPYDLPLVSYSKEDEPWCASKSYTEPDNFGGVWTMG
ncbi:hypothetical protein MMC10_008071 [Thelotrema lepadinum]|nr:hypothetical protein [Thelotrema lepadinum]